MKVLVVHEPGEFGDASEIARKIAEALGYRKPGEIIALEHYENIPAGDETLEELRTPIPVRPPYYMLEV